MTIPNNAIPELRDAARGKDGKLLVMRVEGAIGQLTLVPVSRTGGIFTFWRAADPNDPLFAEALRDEQDRALMTVIVTSDGPIAVPANEYSRPLLTLVAVAKPTSEVTTFDPESGTAPLEETLPPFPAPPEGSPPWYASALRRARRDRAGQWLFKKRRAADGGWTDLLVDSSESEIEVIVPIKEKPTDAQATDWKVGLSPVPGGFAAIRLNDDGVPFQSAEGIEKVMATIAPTTATLASVAEGIVIERPVELDKNQRRVKEGLDQAFASGDTDEIALDLATARIIIFSDHHKGERDGADDFLVCEPAYAAALAYYFHSAYTLYILGDAEELWETKPAPVLRSYEDVLRLEADFYAAGRYERFFGNHDDLWRSKSAVQHYLSSFFPSIQIREALKLRIVENATDLCLIFLAHGHQGTLDSDRFGWASRLIVHYVWRPVQRYLRMASTSLATDHALRASHDVAMYTWARLHSAKPVVIAGHTHHPVFWNQTELDPTLSERHARSRVEMLAVVGGSHGDVADRYAELEFVRAQARRGDALPTQVDPPCYFNTGCCSFGHGAITGIELADGRITLVEWTGDQGVPSRKERATLQLKDVLRAVQQY